LSVALLVTLAACGGDGGSATGGRCLTDAEICQFTEGVSTKQQVQAALGNPPISQTVSSGDISIEQWIYFCMPDAQSFQQVQFAFDGTTGTLFGRTAVSSGPNAPPAPVCP
jgi:hypothetical protein